MDKVKTLEDLVVFQKARELCKDIYRITDVAPFSRDYRFVQQIRAAAGSIMDNIAEGFGSQQLETRNLKPETASE